MKVFPPELVGKEVVVRSRSGKVFDGKASLLPGGGIKLSGGSSTVYVSLSDIMSIQDMEVDPHE